ncbi:hypothetical protein HMPREF0061_0774 [Aerococcus viridans ATCC 11563 = CCUG 4311]|uniref:Uncharacterized protein n=1 Tax=Aerococcus viridans (strain ATCC 11563 / DSM 20340 / CCUG 4311 / JCM 20461 / NBRC 12219 / NCTC 8251 / M1) TaxID=655812 RepID=A0ABP2I7D6_AERVM|nr:hypothetical protein HMPREF0061_0774 [Aerococcus viridans ATCC 11563 = CCUG 4311]
MGVFLCKICVNIWILINKLWETYAKTVENLINKGGIFQMV